MDIKQFSSIMQQYGDKIQVQFTEEQLQKFYKYMNLLIEWNKKINLTAIIEPEDIVLKHFIDSLTILPFIDKNKKIIDIGTGAGFPGIPVSIMRNDVDMTLLDSLNKRINFLNEVIKILNLKNVNTIHSRIEDLAKNKKYRETYDIATSRAVANLSTLSEYMIPMIKTRGISICMKGSDIEEEINKSKKAVDILGGKFKKIEKFILPNSDQKRTIILIEKEKSTPLKYPRKAGTPSKEPL